MKDQVDDLRRKNIPAATLDSTQTMEESDEVKRGVRTYETKILYVAPERLNNEMFVNMISGLKIDLLAIDESHCISEWGSSFRPDYLKIARFAKESGAKRVLALTATATHQVGLDISKGFEIDPISGLFKTSVFRSNLSLLIKPATNDDQKLKYTCEALKDATEPSIVYVTTQQQAVDVAEALKNKGINAKAYHAGMKSEDRVDVQNWFVDRNPGARVVCATIAFGMGIDCPNIRNIVHYYVPKSLEGYSQEVGRSGRDGKESNCLMVPSADDFTVLEGFIRGNTPSRKSLENWMREVFNAERQEDGTIFFNFYNQANEYDMKQETLKLCFAYLELVFELLRAVTPFYEEMDITLTGASEAPWMTDKTPAGQALSDYCVTKRTAGYKINILEISKKSGVSRGEITKLISTYETRGLLTCKGSQVRNRYAVLKEPPQNEGDFQKMVDDLYSRLIGRENDDINRLNKITELIRSEDCMAKQLTTHFGEESGVPGGKCGKCTNCLTGTALSFSSQRQSTISEESFKQALDVCSIRDDPLPLCKFMYGITTPRLTKLKLSRNKLFGSITSCSWDELYQRCKEECEKAQLENVENMVASADSVPTRSTPKRKFGQYKSGQSSNSATAGAKKSKRG